jgi:hypothetical protein
LGLQVVMIMALGVVAMADRAGELALGTSGVSYTNVIVERVPWSIHVVKVMRGNGLYGIQTRHAQGGALGLSPLSDQVLAGDPAQEKPIAAINGGFYERDKAYAGHPRGLQIVQGEVLSAPTGSACFWIDLTGEVRMTNVSSRFTVTWPDGRVTPFELNGERRANGVVLYTPAVRGTTRTQGGREWVLTRQGDSRWLPLRMGRDYLARVCAVNLTGNTPVAVDSMVLSLGPDIMGSFAGVGPGASLRISTASSPSLLGAQSALTAGPPLLVNGRRQKIRSSPDDPYELSSMLERHPRTAFGWNRHSFFLVQVDGRQRDVSLGMTLDELSQFLLRLGCEEALNLDGGGSSGLWYGGQLRNNPCDGYERAIANSLLVVRKQAGGAEVDVGGVTKAGLWREGKGN